MAHQSGAGGAGGAGGVDGTAGHGPLDEPLPRGREARTLLDRHTARGADARVVLDHLDSLDGAVRALARRAQDEAVDTQLAAVPLDRLGDLTERNLRLRALLDAGYATAGDLRTATPAQLERVPGVGEQTARGVVAAVRQLERAVRDSTHLKITTDAEGAPLVRLLDRLLRVRPAAEAHLHELAGDAEAAERLVPAARPAASRLAALRVLLRGRAATPDDDASAALVAVVARDRRLRALQAAGTDPLPRLVELCRADDRPLADVWDDVSRHGARYAAELDRVLPEAAAARRGALPADLVERVEQQTLDLSLVRSRLRGYQAFGARYVLHQGRALLGDEMGLGKTVQALAVMADRTAAGLPHHLVVCPASVLLSWLREVGVHTELVAHRLHGPDRAEATARWLAEGGVGVTTFDQLAHVTDAVDGVGGLASVGHTFGLLVVDEAHQVKNPATRRAQEVARWTSAVWRVLLMTGTPVENHLAEFTELVRLLQPELVDRLPRHLHLVAPEEFRRAVAPVYLRRNQADVLVELPGVTVVEEWEELNPAGAVAYREAVRAGNLMAMRRASYTTACSTTLARVVEVVTDAVENHHRVVVFSFFRDVLDRVRGALADGPHGAPAASGTPLSVLGPLTGSVPASERLALADALGEQPGAVLLAQVVAGGVGLNLQAADVVVLCEPQLTPSMEAQAVARVHRMGQVRPVRVHRLLVAGTVDERLLQLLARKRQVFDDYVRDSAVAASATAAVDVTEAELAREVVAWEQARLGDAEAWEALAGPDGQDGRDGRDGAEQQERSEQRTAEA